MTALMTQKDVKMATMKNAEYATSTDFCQIFNKDMSSLYLLSLLLTGDHEKAEQCFVAGLENAVNRNRVFKEWARGWARRVIIQNALRMINPRPNGGSGSTPVEANDKFSSDRAEIAAVLRLRSFDRFIFVMNVLEDYSEHDCAILLGCSRAEVLAARNRALREIGAAAEARLVQQGTGDRDVMALNPAEGLGRQMYYARTA